MAFLFFGLIFAVGCGHPSSTPKTDPFDSIGVPVEFFPTRLGDDLAEMKSLTVSAMKVGPDGVGVTRLPGWMNGIWSIRGSSRFSKADISEGKIELMLVGGHPLAEGSPSSNSLFHFDFQVIGAETPRSGRLLAIHYGLVHGSDADTLYAGYIEVSERKKGIGGVTEWTFNERSVGYGFGLFQGERERWVFARVGP